MHDIIQVFEVDLSPEEARALSADPRALEEALGTAVAADRVHLVDPVVLADIGLAAYLVEGEGARAEAVSVDKTRLDKVRKPVMLLLPGALTEPAALRVAPPLTHLGEYPLLEGRPAEDPIRTSSAEGLIAGTPPRADDPATDRRASGYVALIAVAVALVVALIVWLVAI